MIVSAFAGVGKTTLAKKYKGDVIDLESGDFKWLNNDGTEASKGSRRGQNPNYPVNYLEAIKKANSQYKVVLISQHEIIRKCLDAVKLDYIIVYPNKNIKEEFIQRYKDRGNNEKFIQLISQEWNNWIDALDKDTTHKKIVLNAGQYLSDFAVELGLATVEELVDTIPDAVIDEVTNEIVETVDKPVENRLQTNNKSLSITDMMNDNFYIDDLTLREFKVVENKVRAGMLIQAKNRLCRVDKLLGTLNKLEDTLFDRIENDIDSMRTDRVIEMTKFISSLIKDTNEMIMSVIGNPKLQNFFIVDNSSNINVDSKSELGDVDRRKKIRHAVQVVLENLDKVEDGNVQEIQDPNIIVGEAQIVKEEGKDVNM